MRPNNAGLDTARAWFDWAFATRTPLTMTKFKRGPAVAGHPLYDTA